MYCKHCGKQIDNDSKFCLFCGGSTISSSPTEGSIMSSSPTIKNKKNKFIVEIIIFLIVFLILRFGFDIDFVTSLIISGVIGVVIGFVKGFSSGYKESKNSRRVQIDNSIRPYDINNLTNDITKLHFLITNKKRKLFNNDSFEILMLLKNICQTKNGAIELIETYNKTYNSDILNEIINLSENYNVIKTYMSTFINLGIVEEQYPHNRKEKTTDEESI